jgi:hypothetical protein
MATHQPHERSEPREGLRRTLDAGVNPSEETCKLAFDAFFGDTLEQMIDSDFDIYKKIKDEPNLGTLFRAVMHRRIAAALRSESGRLRPCCPLPAAPGMALGS